MIITISGSQIRAPQAIKYGIFRISKSGRLSSGLMTMDIIAIKRRIDLTWTAIDGADMSNILSLLDANVFYPITFPDPKVAGAMTSMTAYVGDVDLDYFRSDGNRVWTNVKLPFIEQ